MPPSRAQGSTILAVSHRYHKLKIEGIDAWDGLDAQLCDRLCLRYKKEIWTASHAEAITDPGSGVHMAAIHLHTQERFKAFTIFFRYGQPFSQAELSWAKSFMDLYYEKVLLFNDLYQANEYINHIFEGARFPVLIFDLNGELVSFNQFASQLFHIQRPEEFRRYREDNRPFFDLLALCVDHCGGDVTMEEAIDKLWEDRACDQRSKNLYRKTVSYLRHLFEDLGCPEIFSSARGRCHLNRELVDCDYYRYLSGGNALFAGEYLSNYA